MSNMQIVKNFIRAWNENDIDKACDMLAEDVFYHNIPMPPLNGREASRGMLKGMGDMKAINWELLNIAENGDVVLTERVDGFTFADGKEVALPVMGTFKLVDGEIKEWRDYFDLGDFQRQMAG
ncbi:MAG: nuclear transport factor 2 family protein [Proteobacteria bacterium]|jgi:limonene-1,2-epoxide hydrolase|nr:nuclear transport factor 2 family protein [Pseudomonadota bacterium]